MKDSRIRTGEHAPNRYRLAAVGAIVLVGVFLRISALDQQGYWHDELYSVAHLTGFDAYVLPSSDLNAHEPPRPVAEWQQELERDRFWKTLDRNLVHEGHPPLYQLGLRAWTSLFGSSMGAVRSFSLLPAVLTIPVLYLIGLHLRGRRLAAAAAALIAVSPFHLYYSTESRNYAWALLFSALALLTIVILWHNREAGSSRWTVLWWISVLAAGYTHYYAGIFCGVLLIVFLAFRCRTLGPAMKLGLPFLFFLPWIPVLQEQVNIHSAEHWTVGAPGVMEATGGFIIVVLDQLTGVFGSATLGERVLAAGVLAAGATLVALHSGENRSEANVRWIFLSAPLFGAAVLGVDLATNHHTILVSRYLISMLPCLILLCAWIVTSEHRAFWALFALLIAANLFGSIQTANGERAPKQMLREAATYIGDRYEKKDLVLVTPSGPSLVGMAHYLPQSAQLGGVPPEVAVEVARRRSNSGRTVWLVRQNLGVDTELPVEKLSALTGSPERFVGVDVFRVLRSSRRHP